MTKNVKLIGIPENNFLCIFIIASSQGCILSFASREKTRSYIKVELHKQDRSQPHSPGWARVPLSSFFPQISINFSYFSSNFTYFFFPLLALRMGESPTRKDPGYATVHKMHFRGQGQSIKSEKYTC